MCAHRCCHRTTLRHFIESAIEKIRFSSPCKIKLVTFFRFSVQAFVFDSCKGDMHTSQLKLKTLKSAVQKYGASGNGRIGLFGAMVGWVHEQYYLPQVHAREEILFWLPRNTAIICIVPNDVPSKCKKIHGIRYRIE